MAKILKGRFYKLGRDDFEIILSGFFSFFDGAMRDIVTEKR